MSIKVGFDYCKNEDLYTPSIWKDRVREIHKIIVDKTGAGGDFLGWLDYPERLPKSEIDRIIKKANFFRDNYEVLVVCGIGGSYLGPRAVIEAINGLYSNDKMKIVYLGNTLDPNYSNEVLNYIKDKKFCVCVISKSGTTTETSISFRILKELAEQKYGKDKAKDAIVAVTDKEKGALRQLSDTEGYETFELPGDIGGRFSVMTPVGLFPIACAGIDIYEFIKGLKDGMKNYSTEDLDQNEAYKYALERHALYLRGCKVEMVTAYEPRLECFNGWIKQLYDESEGKEGKSLLVTSCVFTTDLHSLGQFIQEGSKILFETVTYFEEPNTDVVIPYDKDNLDNLNYIAGKKLSYVNKKAYEGTLQAHSGVGNVPNITITIDKLTPRSLGELLYFHMKACAMSAYLNGLNPFNQPGVEVYKKNMFHLLGKPVF